MDSELQEPVQEHVPQEDDDDESPPAADNLPTKVKQEHDRGVVSNPTLQNAGHLHKGIDHHQLSLAWFCSLELILDPDIPESVLDEPEIEQIPSNGQPGKEDVHSGTTEKDTESYVKEEVTTEDISGERPDHGTQAEDIVEQSEHLTPCEDQYTGNDMSDVEESAVRQTSSRDSGMHESHNGEQTATGFQHEEVMEDSREGSGPSQFFDDLQPPENNPFDYLDRENGMNGLDTADPWPTEQREETEFQLGENDSSRRNPFEGLSEDPEFGESMFGDGKFDIDDRPDPESQGYTLLQNDDDDGANDDPFDPEMGHTSADVHDAQHADNMPSFHESQQDTHHDYHVAAFSQVHESLSQGVTGLEFVAHQLVDPSETVPQGMTSQTPAPASAGEAGERWWSSNENAEQFNFGQQDEEQNPSNLFESSNDVSQHFPVKEEDSQEDPFSQLLASNESREVSAPKGRHHSECELIVR